MANKANIFLAAAAMALNIEPTAGAVPIVESLLNDKLLNGVYVAQVDSAGHCIMFVAVADTAGGPDAVRPVATSAGEAKLFASLAAAQSTIKRCRLSEGSQVQMARFEKAMSITDPVAALKMQYKGYKAEKAAAVKSLQKVAASLATGVALGWSTSSGTPEAAAYAGYVQQKASIDEAIAYLESKVASVAAVLVTLNVDPATVI
jgi:hypothetical protein